MDKEQLVPQREPFLFIDEINQLKPGIFGCATTKIRGDEDFFRGHFPGHPVFPGVLMIEAAGQLANAVIRANSEDAESYLYYSKMSKVKFMGELLPGDTMQVEVEVNQRVENLVFTHVCIKKEEEKIFSADIVFCVMEEKK